nr:hypothetical protein [Nannocystis pusilla]
MNSPLRWVTSGAKGQLATWRFGQERVDDLLRRGAAHRLAAVGAVLGADAGVEHAQVVVDLRDRADGRARVVGGALLLDRNRRRQAAQVLDLRPLELAQELARVGRQALDVAPLPLGVEGVEGEARLARAAHAGEDDELALGDEQLVDLQVVLVRALDLDEVGLAHGAQAGGPFRGVHVAVLARVFAPADTAARLCR